MLTESIGLNRSLDKDLMRLGQLFLTESVPSRSGFDRVDRSVPLTTRSEFDRVGTVSVAESVKND